MLETFANACLLYGAFKSKKYRYFWVNIILLIYIFVEDPSQYIFVNITDANVISMLTKLIPLFLTGLLYFFAKHEQACKGRWLPTILSGAACAVRFLRSLLFKVYTSNMKLPGADVPSVYQEFVERYSFMDVAMKSLLIIMMFSLFGQLTFGDATNS